MKIKTITCHHVYNPGASLQAYALLRYLKEEGNDVEIIDYLPSYLTEEYKFFSVTNKTFKKHILLKLIYVVLKIPSKISFLRRKKYYEIFKREYLEVTATSYSSNEELKRDCPKADLYIAGSDQIWNTAFPNGKDPAFYLDFVSDKAIKVAYAASFGSNEIDNTVKRDVTRMLNNLDYISVREKSAVRMLKGIGIHSTQVCDPVFLLGKTNWKEMALQCDKPGENYIFVYDFDNNPLIKEVASCLAKKYQLKIYSMFKNEKAEKGFYASGPLEFLSLIYHSRFVVTNSFHAIAFSLIFEKEFWATKRKENLNSRMTDLLQEFDLTKRMVGTANDITDEEINYQDVNNILDCFVDKSKRYLNMSMERTDGNR